MFVHGGHTFKNNAYAKQTHMREGEKEDISSIKSLYFPYKHVLFSFMRV